MSIAIFWQVEEGYFVFTFLFLSSWSISTILGKYLLAILTFCHRPLHKDEVSLLYLPPYSTLFYGFPSLQLVELQLFLTNWTMRLHWKLITHGPSCIINLNHTLLLRLNWQLLLFRPSIVQNKSLMIIYQEVSLISNFELWFFICFSNLEKTLNIMIYHGP